MWLYNQDGLIHLDYILKFYREIKIVMNEKTTSCIVKKIKI